MAINIFIKYLLDIRTQIFLKQDTKEQVIKEKYIKCERDFVDIKTCFLKDTIKKIKGQTQDWKNV